VFEGLPDVDGDGICDNEDDCVGEYDPCGVCLPPGSTSNNVDSDNDGVCDFEDPCPYDLYNDLDQDGLCGCTLTDGITTYIDEELCGYFEDLDNDDDGVLNNLDPCPNDSYWLNGIKGYDLDYTLNYNGGFITETECLEIEGAFWNAYSNHCGDGICDSSDSCVGVGTDSYDCIPVDESELSQIPSPQ
jgi:hypothetical protein